MGNRSLINLHAQWTLLAIPEENVENWLFE